MAAVDGILYRNLSAVVVTLPSIQTISRRQIYDAAIEQRRTEEDERYGAILAARGPEEDQNRQMQMAEDALLKAAALGNVNLSDLESHIVMFGFACVGRK